MGRFGRFRRGRNSGNIQQKWLRRVPQAIESPPFVVGAYTPYIADDIYEQQRQGSQEFESEHAPIAPIFTEDRVEATPASQVFPFSINLKDYISGIDPSKESYDINITEIEEMSASVVATPWAEDNTFALLDDDGTVYWVPRGNYLDSFLRITYEVNDGFHPASENARVAGRVYFGDTEPPASQITVGQAPPTVGETVLAIENDIIDNMDSPTIGGGEKETPFWQNQGMDPTCALACVSSVLLSLGITDANGNLLDYDRLLEAAISDIMITADDEPITLTFKGIQARLVQMRNPDIDPAVYPRPAYLAKYDLVLVEPSKPGIPKEFIDYQEYDLPGVPRIPPQEYIDIIRNGDVMQTKNYLNTVDINSLTSAEYQYLQDLYNYRSSPEYDGFIERRPTNVQNNAAEQGWNIVPIMLDHYDIPNRTVSGTGWDSVIRALENGEKVIVFADRGELANSPAIEHIHDTTQLMSALDRNQNLLSAQNHAVWITEIIPGDDINSTLVRINDPNPLPNRMGNGTLYPITLFMGATEDAELTFTAVGGTEPPASIDILEAEIRKTGRETLIDLVDGTLGNKNRNTSGKDLDDVGLEFKTVADRPIISLIENNPDFLDEIDKQFPGTKAKYEQYQLEKTAEKARIIEEYGIDIDEYEEFLEELEEGSGE